MAEISYPRSGFAAVMGRDAARPAWQQAAIIVGATALVALCAHISVPLGFTPVPVTLQPFAVLLLGLLLGPRTAFAALTLYLAEGAAGLPVFNPHGAGGLGQLFGYTGGYLLAAPFAAALASVVYRLGRRRFSAALAGAAVGDLVLLTVGALWLGLLERTTPSVLFHQAVLPFLGSDAAKVIAAAGCAWFFARINRRGAAGRAQ